MLQQPCFNSRLRGEIADLNQRFIDLLLYAGRHRRIEIESGLLHRIERTRQRDPSRITETPFLLYRVVRDLEAQPGIPPPGCLPADDERVSDLVTLTMGFLWQVARDDLLVASVVAGAGRAWCGQLAALSIAQLAGVSLRAGLQARLIDVPGYWQDLARRRGISALQRASLGAAGMQIILSRSRRERVEQSFRLPVAGSAPRT